MPKMFINWEVPNPSTILSFKDSITKDLIIKDLTIKGLAIKDSKTLVILVKILKTLVFLTTIQATKCKETGVDSEVVHQGRVKNIQYQHRQGHQRKPETVKQ